MRIFLITSKLNFKTAGGSVIDLHLKAQSLQELGHQVTVVTLFSSANQLTIPLTYPVRFEQVAGPSWLKIQQKCFQILRKYEREADVFYLDGHIFLYGGGFYRWLFGKIPVVAFFNIRLSSWYTPGQKFVGSFGEKIYRRVKKFLRYWLEKTLGFFWARRLDYFVFNTPMVQKMYENFGLGKGRSSIIEDFVNTLEIINRERISPQKIAKKQSEDREITIFSSGRMIPDKGFDLVLKAFATLKNKEGLKVIMSGDGPERARLQKMAEDLKIGSYFHFPGWVEKKEMAEFFRQAHIFIFPKWWLEYGSVVLTEAMAYGLASLVPAGGALEWLSAGGAATFKPDSAEDLAEKIELLAGNRRLRISIAEKAWQKSARLDYKKLGLSLEKVILLAQKR